MPVTVIIIVRCKPVTVVSETEVDFFSSSCSRHCSTNANTWSVTVPLSISSITVANSASPVTGAGGGAVVTLTGTGFAPDGHVSRNNVSVCGQPAVVTAATATSVSFIVPEVPTAAVNE